MRYSLTHPPVGGCFQQSLMSLPLEKAVRLAGGEGGSLARQARWGMAVAVAGPVRLNFRFTAYTHVTVAHVNLIHVFL